MSIFTRLFRTPVVAPATFVLAEARPAAIVEAGELLTDVFGDGMTASGAGGHFTCIEADKIARALVLLGHSGAAETWLEGHAEADDPGDNHRVGDVDDWDAPDGRAMNEQEIAAYVDELVLV